MHFEKLFEITHKDQSWFFTLTELKGGSRRANNLTFMFIAFYYPKSYSTLIIKFNFTTKFFSIYTLLNK